MCLTGVSANKIRGFVLEKTCSGSMSKSGLLCYNGPVSTLCCEAGRWQKDGLVRKMGILILLPCHISALQDLDDAWQNKQKRAFAGILGRWTSTVYSGVQGSPRQSHHLFPLVQPLYPYDVFLSGGPVAHYSRLATGAAPGPMQSRRRSVPPEN
jgi:hypothetical protein